MTGAEQREVVGNRIGIQGSSVGVGSMLSLDMVMEETDVWGEKRALKYRARDFWAEREG